MPQAPPKVELLQIEEGRDFRLCYAEGVQNLIPFQNLQNGPFLLPSLRGDAQKIGSDLNIQFEVIDPGHCLRLPRGLQCQGQDLPRKEDLWKNTCFEMFLQPIGRSDYYEFNFSLTPAWNLYHFKDYRAPQPPTWSDDFKVRNLSWDGRDLRIEVYSLFEIPSCRVGLTSVVKSNLGETSFLALAHAGKKPDFHLADSFILNL